MPRPKRGIVKEANKDRISCAYCPKSYVYWGAYNKHLLYNHVKEIERLKEEALRERAEKAERAWNANNKNRLVQLPHDVVVCIMKSIDGFPDLENFAVTNKRFYMLYRQYHRSICSTIAKRLYPPEALQLLNLWRPGGMSDFTRQILEAHPFEFGRHAWKELEVENLSENKEVIGRCELIRLRRDANIVDEAVDSWIAMQRNQYNQATSAVAHVTALRRFFDKPAPLQITDKVRERIRVAVYRIMLLAPHFYPNENGMPRYYVDIYETRFDYTYLMEMPLMDLIHMFVVADASVLRFAELSEEIQLEFFLRDRLLDKSKCEDDWDSYVEELRDLKLKGVWEPYQDRVKALVEKVEGGSGYNGGLNSVCYKKKIITVPGPDGTLHDKEILKLKKSHFRHRTDLSDFDDDDYFIY